ncbi:MAG TPA: PTS sugar transporter subunit IIA [Gemmatimonadales bacterium]|nr:PTS sugar transporter subunit IIA [Gemmatimonadales bacterium]
MLLSELLAPDRVRVPLTSRDKSSVLRELVDLLVLTTGGSADDILHAVREREACQSTGFGHGVAIPHARTPTLPGLTLVAGQTTQPIDYGALDGKPVRLFFLLAGPEAMAASQVRALARIARLVRREYVRDRLLEAGTSEAFCRVVREAEGR